MEGLTKQSMLDARTFQCRPKLGVVAALTLSRIGFENGLDKRFTDSLIIKCVQRGVTRLV